MAASPLGVIVVGMGRAGNARIRDIKQYADSEDFPGVNLIGFVSRRSIEIEAVAQLDYDAALKREDVHAVIICTENETHANLARRAIEAGKHVLVEFPLATIADTAKQLQGLAADKGVVCYEEDISLLTSQYLTLSRLVKEKGLPLEMEQSLEGRFNGWIENMQKSGPPFTSSINMLHNFLWLFGDLSPIEGHIKQGEKRQEAFGKLCSKEGGVTLITRITRGTDCAPRNTNFSITFKDGTIVNAENLKDFTKEPTQTSKYGLFMQDFQLFLKQVREPVDHTQQDWVTARALELADQLYHMAKDSPLSHNL